MIKKEFFHSLYSFGTLKTIIIGIVIIFLLFMLFETTSGDNGVEALVGFILFGPVLLLIFVLGCSLLITSVISGFITYLMIFKPTLFDNILSDTKTTYNKNVDPNKYELIVSNNKENLEFDNKGDKNIILTYNDRKIDNKIFKIIDQTDTHYIVEVQIIDYGFFSDTVRTERVSIHK